MIYLLVFMSGVAGLVYEVLWMKQLGLLFGNTSHAAAATLAAFFAGLAVGSWFWARRCSSLKNPLKVYALLEVGIAFTALLYFVILSLFYRIYPSVYQGVASQHTLLAVKFGLALLLVFPPAFCMGGTIPVMGQYLIRNLSKFGAVSALLYGINTLGAAIGACLAGFYLPLWLGFKATCLSAVAVSLLIAAIALVLAKESTQEAAEANASSGEPRSRKGRWAVLGMCFVSGFGVLALEVLWTRMFTQVLENSVYTFAAILVVVLVCLAVGSFISSLLARLKVGPFTMLMILTILGSLAIGITPIIFMKVTNSLEIIVSMGTWSDYVLLIYGKVLLTIGAPAVLLGTVFPYLMKTEERYADSAGKSLGTLAAINTAGAIIGSLLCGFVFLGNLGMWATMQRLAVIYTFAGLLIPCGWTYRAIALKGGCAVLMLLHFSALDPSGLPINSIDRMRMQERIVETWEGSDCTVAVAEGPQGISIKINSHYGLGSTGAFLQERIQADLPLMVYPETKSIFFLGIGTGITAGSALHPQFSNVTSIVACELVPEVITAAKKYITNVQGYDYTGGLFSDPRASVIIEDGRHYIMASGKTFDMVNSDLFVPFRSGAGSLYSLEHFESVREALNPGGVFVQWLPLYQLTEYEVHIIARTMLEVFDSVTMWRSNFQPGEEVAAFIGHLEAATLPAHDLDSRADKEFAVKGKTARDLANLALPFNPQTILLFYCGNMSEASELFDEYPINTDDKPVIEYMSPRTYRNRKDAAVPWFVGPRIAKLADAVQKSCPPDKDPFLANRSPEDRMLPLAGSAYHWARIWEVIGDRDKCEESWGRFVEQWVPEESDQ